MPLTPLRLRTATSCLLLAALSLPAHAQFTRTAEYGSGDPFGAYSLAAGDTAFTVGQASIGAPLVVRDMDGAVRAAFDPRPGEDGFVLLEGHVLTPAESLPGGRDVLAAGTVDGTLKVSIYHGGSGTVTPLVGGADLVRTDGGASYLASYLNDSRGSVTEFRVLPTRALALTLPGYIDYRPGAGGGGFVNLHGDVRIRYNDDLTLRYAFDVADRGYQSVKRIGMTTLSDGAERFFVSSRDTIDGVRHTRHQIIDTAFNVVFDTAFVGGLAEVQLRPYPEADVLRVVHLGGGGSHTFCLRASTLRPLPFADPWKTSGHYEGTPALVFRGADSLYFVAIPSFDTLGTAPSRITYEDRTYAYGENLTDGPHADFNGLMLRYYPLEADNPLILFTDQYGTPLETLAVDQPRSSPTI